MFNKLIKSLHNRMPMQRKHYIALKEMLEQQTKLILNLDGPEKLNFMLKSANVPPKYYDIFINMLQISSNAGCTQDFMPYGNTTPPPTKTRQDCYRPICIDGGAHIGTITDIILYCGGISYAFEPNQYLQKFLQTKYSNNPQVILSSNALSNKFYTTRFQIDKEGIFSQGNCIMQRLDSTQDSYEVGVIDLSTIIQKVILPKYKRIYLLKLDVEGAEFDILDSILNKKLYESIDYIVCETHERFFADGDSKIQSLKNRITECGAKNIYLDWI